VAILVDIMLEVQPKYLLLNALVKITTYDAPYYFGYPAIAIKVNSTYAYDQLEIETSLGNVFVVYPLSQTISKNAQLSDTITVYSNSTEINVSINKVDLLNSLGSFTTPDTFLDLFLQDVFEKPQNISISQDSDKGFPPYTTVVPFLENVFDNNGIYNGTSTVK